MNSKPLFVSRQKVGTKVKAGPKNIPDERAILIGCLACRKKKSVFFLRQPRPPVRPAR